MTTLLVNRSTNTKQDQIFTLLNEFTWSKCRTSVKQLYTAIKNTLTEDEQETLLLDIYMESLIDDSYSEYWQYMNR